jgi:hypothetical protein
MQPMTTERDDAPTVIDTNATLARFREAVRLAELAVDGDASVSEWDALWNAVQAASALDEALSQGEPVPDEWRTATD